MSIANVCLVAGIIIVLVAFLGCCGAITENKIMLFLVRYTHEFLILEGEKGGIFLGEEGGILANVAIMGHNSASYKVLAKKKEKVFVKHF